MSKPDQALLIPRLEPADTPAPVARRINVAVNSTTMFAIDRVIANERVTLTEAVRRLLACGDLVYEVTKVRKAKLIVREANGDEREVLVM